MACKVVLQNSIAVVDRFDVVMSNGRVYNEFYSDL